MSCVRMVIEAVEMLPPTKYTNALVCVRVFSSVLSAFCTVNFSPLLCSAYTRSFGYSEKIKSSSRISFHSLYGLPCTTARLGNSGFSVSATYTGTQ